MVGPQYVTHNESIVTDIASQGLWDIYNITSVVLEIARTYYEKEYPLKKRELTWEQTWIAGHYNCWVYSEVSKDIIRKYLL